MRTERRKISGGPSICAGAEYDIMETGEWMGHVCMIDIVGSYDQNFDTPSVSGRCLTHIVLHPLIFSVTYPFTILRF